MKKLTGSELLARAMKPKDKAKKHKKTMGATLQGSYKNPQANAFGGAGSKGIQSQANMKLQGKKHKKNDASVTQQRPGVNSQGNASSQVMNKKSKKHKKNWIAGAIKKPGALKKELEVKKDSKIPTKKLNAAAGKKGVVGKRARLAQTLESFHKKHKKASSKVMCKRHNKADCASCGR